MSDPAIPVPATPVPDRSAPAISVQSVWKFFGEFPAVRNVSLDVPVGAVLALLGRNGAGKTTLIRMMAGLLRPSKGDITLGSVPANGDANGDANGQPATPPVGVVGHGQWVYEDLTARENLAFFARLYEIADPEKNIDHWIEQVGLWTFRDSRVNEFSRGMRQRLTIARALLHDPEILLLDEPWTALDDRAMDLLSSLLLQAHEPQRTVVVCSHQLRETLQVATDLAVLERGRLIFSGANQDSFKSSPHEFYQLIS